jgi:hypothetical protein
MVIYRVKTMRSVATKYPGKYVPGAYLRPRHIHTQRGWQADKTPVPTLFVKEICPFQTTEIGSADVSDSHFDLIALLEYIRGSKT